MESIHGLKNFMINIDERMRILENSQVNHQHL